LGILQAPNPVWSISHDLHVLLPKLLSLLEWAKEQIFPLAQGPAEVIGVGEVLIHQGKTEQ
jgi:hypothetical protein